MITIELSIKIFAGLSNMIFLLALVGAGHLYCFFLCTMHIREHKTATYATVTIDQRKPMDTILFQILDVI